METLSKSLVKILENDRAITPSSYGILTPSAGYELDYRKTVAIGIITAIAFLWWCLLHLGQVFMFDEYLKIIGFIIIAIGFLIALYLSDKNQGVRFVNGYRYDPRLNKTHDLVYKCAIVSTKYANFAVHENVLSLFGRRMTKFGDTIFVEIPCPWARAYIPYGGVPEPLIDRYTHPDDLKKAFPVVVKVIGCPNFTGIIEYMEYAGQKHIYERVKTND